MRRGAWALALVLLVASCAGGARELAMARGTELVAPLLSGPSPTTTTVPTTTTRPATEARTPPPPASDNGPWTIGPYRGFGAWLDAFDWSAEFAGPDGTPVGTEAIDHMAAEGVETVYIQGARWNGATDVIEPDRLRALIERSHHHDMTVVAWYLPTLVDPDADFRRIMAVADTGVDGIAIDIEARDVADVAERNRRLISLSARLRDALPDKTLGAIVLEPVLLEDVNPDFWPSFPWAEIAPYYDVWLPMSYWTNRVGPWRSAHTYTSTNIARIRERIGMPDAPIHPIGGVGDRATVEDLEAMVRAAADHGTIGGSLYDYRTSRPEFWSVLRAFRTG